MDDFRTVPDSPLPPPLEEELRALVRVGLPEARQEQLPGLFGLRCVRQEIRADGDADHVLALEHALKKAVALLGAGDRADAARALIGLDPRTRSWKRPRRREAATDALLGPGYDPQTFRRRYEQTLLADVAYALHKLESHVRLGFPLTPDELACVSLAPKRKDATGSDEGFRLIRTAGELKATLFHIVEEANECLVTTGSRSRDPDYLTAIEAKLARQPDVVHYRVLFGPPRRQPLKDHLAHLLDIRSPESRRGGNKTIFIGLFDDAAKEPESAVCANENRAFVRLPSMNGMQKYDTGVEFRGPAHASRYVRLVQELYSASRPVENKSDVLALPVLDQGPALASPG
jgi:hypothetical protein